MILYGNSTWTSPYVLSCFVALREKGIAFDVRDVALDRGEQWDPTFAKPSVTARVPMLVDGDVSLTESSAIVEYLEEAYPPPGHAAVMPKSIADRARARQVMAWIRSDLMAIREERSAEWVFYPHGQLQPFKPLSDAAQRAVKKLFAAADALVPAGEGPLFGAWCVADTDLAMMLQRLVRCGDDVPARLRAYAQTQFERPAIKEFEAHKKPPFRAAQV